MAKDRIYAVVWSPSHHRVVKTKTRGNQVLRVWKRWYERQGWRVSRLGDGYVARMEKTEAPEGIWYSPHAVQLHAYDVLSKERVSLVKPR